MAKRSLPPGFRFHPTDAELVKYYLKRKVMGQRLHFDAISELNIYNYCPWDLPDKSCLGSKDLVWYFFCPNEKKYASGARTNRATESGYWKSTGKDRPVFYNHQTVGMVKTLVFHIGRSPRGQRTNWVLYEYRIQDKELTDVGIVQDAYVLCKVFQKSGPGPKANAQYGAPLSEEDWDDDAEYGLSLPSSSLLPPELPHNNDISVRICMYISGSTFCGPSTESSPSNILPSTNEVPLAFPNNEDLSCLSDIMKDSSYVLPDHTVNSEVVENFSDKNNIESLTGLDGAEMDYVLGDVYTGGELSGGGSNEKNSEGLTCLDGDGIGLEDLDNWPELTGGEFSLTSTHTADYGGVPFAAGEKMEFLELDDLNSPLNFTTEATGSQYSLTDIFFEPWHNNCLGEDYLPVDNFGANQHVPVMNQLPMLSEEYNGHGNLFGLFQENSGLIENADLGFTAASYWEDIFTSCEHLEDTTGRLAGKDNHG